MSDKSDKLNSDDEEEKKGEESKEENLNTTQAQVVAKEMQKPLAERIRWEAVDDQILLKFDLIQKMGRGNYGTVWKAIDKRDRSRIAIKKINNAFHNMIDA